LGVAKGELESNDYANFIYEFDSSVSSCYKIPFNYFTPDELEIYKQSMHNPLFQPKNSNLNQPKDTLQNPIQDIPNLTKLSTDKSIYHQYIKDYLACPTKFYQVLNGGYIYDGLDQYAYKCVPKDMKHCSYDILIYGLPPLVGQKIPVGEFGSNQKYTIVEADKYYCRTQFESFASISIDTRGGYGIEYFPKGLDKKVPGYFVIPKSKLPYIFAKQNDGVSFVAIPLSSFSPADQEYISKNFEAQ
jgi:hypothetical protein